MQDRFKKNQRQTLAELGAARGSGERRQLACGVWQLAKHNIVGKLPTIAGKLPALPGGRVRRS